MFELLLLLVLGWSTFPQSLALSPSSVCNFDPVFGGKILLDCDTKEKSVVKFQTEQYGIKATVKCTEGDPAFACLGPGPRDSVTLIVGSDDRKEETLCASSFFVNGGPDDFKTTCTGENFKIEQRLTVEATRTTTRTTSPTTSPTSSPSTTPTTSPRNSPTTSPTNSPTISPTTTRTTSPTTTPSSSPSTFLLTNGVWIETDANASIDKRHEACFVMAGSKAYLLGGRRSLDLDIFDPVMRAWSKGEPSPIELHHMQCVAAQGLIWIVAAWTGTYPRENNTDVSYVYDPAADVWSTKTAMPEHRRRGGAAVVVSPDETKLYVSHGNVGGHETEDHAVSLGWLDVYDIATDTWTALSDTAPNPRDHCGGSWVDGRICVAGGRNGGERGWPTVRPTDCYDVATGIWTEEASIPQERAGSSYGTTCDGELMVAGGEGFNQAWDNVDVFDGRSWITLDSLNIARHGIGLAVNCACHQIYIASGATARGGRNETTSVETFFMGGEDVPCSL